MLDIPVIELENVSKKFRLYKSKKERLKEALNLFSKSEKNDFYAIKNISMKVNKGEIIGIIGKNGSGKSTLLKVISGIVTQTSGTVVTRGKIIPLLELGAGFHPHFTGLENIYFYSVLLGFPRAQIEQKVDKIIEYSELGDFINQPVKTYSSGMKSRLAFSVSIMIEPEILILDEVLAVGDEYFKEKSFKKMQEFFASRKTILFVSHSSQQINELCHRAIMLDKGEILAQGDTETVTNFYKIFWQANSEKKEELRQKALESSI
jgi:ABC-type polysaccharide/polyol phosphate transport system ATPase subunit